MSALFSAFIDALGLADSLSARLKRAFSHPRALQAELDRAQAPAAGSRARATGCRPCSPACPRPRPARCCEDLWAIAGIQPVGGRKPAEIVHRLAERAAAARAPRLSEAEAGLVQRYLAIAEAPRGGAGTHRGPGPRRPAGAGRRRSPPGRPRLDGPGQPRGAPEARMTPGRRLRPRLRLLRRLPVRGAQRRPRRRRRRSPPAAATTAWRRALGGAAGRAARWAAWCARRGPGSAWSRRHERRSGTASPDPRPAVQGPAEGTGRGLAGRLRPFS